MKLGLRWKIIAIYATVLIAGVAIAAEVVQSRYQTIFIEQKITALMEQQAVILAKIPFYLEQTTFQSVNEVQTLIFSADKTVLAQSGFPEQRLLNELTQIAFLQQQPNLQYHYEIGDELMNVQITKVTSPQPLMVVSYVLTGVPSFLSNVLLQEVVFLFLFLFVVGSGIFLLWMLYVARDLKRIAAFAATIGKRDWQAQLRVKRHDEIGAIAQQLQAVQQQLALSEAQQQRFFHHTSHDLKTPIAVIQGYAEAIEDGLYPQGDLKTSVQIIQTEANRLNHKVEQLLRYAKMQQPQTHQKEYSDVVDIAQALVGRFQPLYPELTIVLETDLVACLWPGSTWQWEQVLENLLDNSLRYAQTTITVNVTKLTLAIENDGPSIPSEQQALIFAPFATGAGGQYGLGLAICHEFAQYSGYQLTVDNTASGVRFMFVREQDS